MLGGPVDGETSKKKTSNQMHSKMTQTEETLWDRKPKCHESRAMQTETTHQSSRGDREQSGNKKRTASSLLETHKQEKKVRTTQRRIDKTPAITKTFPERNQNEPGWQTVEHRKRKKKKEEEQTGQTSNIPENRANGAKSQARRRLPEAVAIRISDGASYAIVLKDLKSKVDPQRLGLQVRGIRKTRAGEILTELQNGSKAEKLKVSFRWRRLSDLGRVSAPSIEQSA